MKKFISALLIASVTISLAACSGSSEKAPETPKTEEGKTTVAEPDKKEFKVLMVTDTGGVSDQSFNQSAWEGFTKFEKDGLGKANYMESHNANEYTANLSKAAEEDNDLIWGVGFLFADPIIEISTKYPEKSFAIVDNAYDDTPANVTGVMFKANEPSFLVGYMAAKTTKTDKVGFIGGIEGFIISQFDYGFKAGVATASKEMGKEVEVITQYANSFSDDALGKGIATSMYSQGVDIIFHAAGNVGQGVIAAAKEQDKLVIGVDMDQSALAPDNVMTSAMKLVGSAVYDLSKKAKDGAAIGGETFWYGIKEGACGIPEYSGSTEKLVEKDVYDATKAIEAKIVSGEIVVPANAEEFEAFKSGL